MEKLSLIILLSISFNCFATDDKTEELLSLDIDSLEAIEQNFPELIETSYVKKSTQIGADKKAKTIKTTQINYNRLVPNLVKLVQAQQKQIDSLTNNIDIKSKNEKVRGKAK
ncbi:MAG: hypothetical protein ACOYL6_13455 [Bacteriovoracaceae bacterium]